MRERKYLSGCQCGICPSQTGKLCAQQTASLLSEKPGGFFDSLRPPEKAVSFCGNPRTSFLLVPLPLGKGGFGDGRCGLPRALCALAMTGFPWSVVHGRRATARVAPTEGYKECLAGGRTGASAPTDMWKRLRRTGLQEVRQNGPSGTPAPTEGYKGCGRRADVGIGPYGSACRGGRPCPPSPGNATLCRAGPACPAAASGKKNPPVTALPCQPPLKGAGSCEA